MKQEQQTTGSAFVSVVIIGGDRDSLTPEQKPGCCQQFFEALGMTELLPESLVVPELDFWGHKKTTGPAFPDSLFISDEALLKLLLCCNDKKELTVLYNDNRERIEKNTCLKDAFTGRQEVLNRP